MGKKEDDTKKNVKQIRVQNLDKFYTTKTYSKKCIDIVFQKYNISDFDLIIEPSAGDGSFYHQIDYDKKIGIDILPEDSDIIKMDFFQYEPPPEKNILVIGNPPFGKICSLAIKFFNHASSFANIIAFIIPRTFRRSSVQNKLHKNFHLVYDEDVPLKPSCFTPSMMAKCCFQIWEKHDEERSVVYLPTHHHDWDFLPLGSKDERGQPTPPNGADFGIRAYGGKIGEIIVSNLQTLRPKSWHWIKCNIDKKKLMNVFKQIDYSMSLNTTRQNSMGKGDLVKLYKDFLDSKK